MRRLLFAFSLALFCSVPRTATADTLAERRMAADRLVTNADPKVPSGRLRLAEAAAIYASLHREACETTASADARTCAELLYNAASTYESAGDAPRALALYRTLSDLRELVPRESHGVSAGEGPLARKALFRLAVLDQRMSLHEEAAVAYEQFAVRYPREVESPKALVDAMALRLALRQETEAARDVATLVRTYDRRGSPSGEAVLRLATHLASASEWARVESSLAGATSLLEQQPIHLRIQAHVLLGRALAHGPLPASASAEYARARDLWKDPTAAEAALRASHPDDDTITQDRRLALTLDAVGEALFALAEERRVAEVERVRLAPFTGPATVPAVKAYVAAKAAPWLQAKLVAMRAVEPAFVAILDVKPVPPPRWVIAAAGSVGMMWGRFSEELGRIPMPDPWKKDRLLASAHADSMKAMRIQIRDQHARPAIKKCLDLSVKYQFQDEGSRRCAAWLVAEDASEYHAVEELVPALRSAAVPAHETPCRFDGEPLFYLQ